MVGLAKAKAVVLLIALAGCQAPPSTQNAANVVADDCLDLPVYPPPGVTDLKQQVTACVERNAALYAKGLDSPDDLSKAVIVKCQPAIMQYVEQQARKGGERPQYTEALEAWRQHALPVIAEARARRCYS
jgi:hypothetical protein